MILVPLYQMLTCRTCCRHLPLRQLLPQLHPLRLRLLQHPLRRVPQLRQLLPLPLPVSAHLAPVCGLGLCFIAF
jgi:hypothetical protein